MDPVRNPYAPGAGTPPPELAGRSSVLEQARIALSRVEKGKPAQSLILVGLRGVGKTVLLNKIKEIAEELHYNTIISEADENQTLPYLIIPGLRSALFSLDKVEGAKDKAKRGLRVLKSFLSGLRVSINELEFGLTIDPETGVADSGVLESDLPELMLSIGEAAKAASRPVAIFLDELQYLTQEEFSALIMSMHRLNQNNMPIILIGAGLPQILGLAGETKSYSERLFSYPTIGALTPSAAKAAIVNPARAEGVEFRPAAVAEILKVTSRYPYFLQQWGHDAWNIAADSPISKSDVKQATAAAIKTLDQSFFRVRFDRCTPAERRYLRALAEFGPGPHRSGDIADELGVKITSVGPVRNKLIKKGMIYSPQYGDTEFTVPLFDAYMRRVMPTI